MIKNIITTILCLFFMPIATIAIPQQSICTVSDASLNGTALQENRLYCPASTSFFTFAPGASFDTLAPSTYEEALQLATQKHIIVGTPLSVIETFDWVKCPITYVEFTSGFHAEHHNVGNACNPDLTVRYYDNYNHEVWP